ncbi:hypothetical protein MDOR_30890 [Mycolicibacterium doricum]|uniref:Transposase n=1 Tax=Mycolicibacterium doricum TaxID=126673 RepID=A0A7I7VVD0_9MYCO|nr:hypothetical protein MDOR_30890 [Mycolicibacterium doricum]
MSVARFIADQRTKYRVPHTITCVLLGVSVSWFYKWITRAESADGLHTDTDRRARARYGSGGGVHRGQGAAWVAAADR